MTLFGRKRIEAAGNPAEFKKLVTARYIEECAEIGRGVESMMSVVGKLPGGSDPSVLVEAMQMAMCLHLRKLTDPFLKD